MRSGKMVCVSLSSKERTETFDSKSGKQNLQSRVLRSIYASVRNKKIKCLEYQPLRRASDDTFRPCKMAPQLYHCFISLRRHFITLVQHGSPLETFFTLHATKIGLDMICPDAVVA